MLHSFTNRVHLPDFRWPKWPCINELVDEFLDCKAQVPLSGHEPSLSQGHAFPRVSSVVQVFPISMGATYERPLVPFRPQAQIQFELWRHLLDQVFDNASCPIIILPIK